MESEKRFVGIDLGAGSGRVMLGTLAGGKLEIEELHRFPNEPVSIGGTMYWNFTGLLQEIQVGLGAAARSAGGHVDGIGVDTWGVDFGLLDRDGKLLSPPVHYRDARTEGMMEEVFRTVPESVVFEETGIQFMPLNTLYQLASVQKRTPEVLKAAGKLLLMADLVHYYLTGRAVAEMTLTSTSQMWNPRTKSWSRRILEALGIPVSILPEVVPPGTVLGELHETIAREAGLKDSPPVIASACHDTAAAVAAVPADGSVPWAYLSSGTWSLLGVELPEPRITPDAQERNFTNEGGVAGTTRFLKNINGLWLIQECRRVWARQGEDLDYAEITRQATQATSSSYIQPGDPAFFAPDDMPAEIQEFCRRTSQPVPTTKGEIARCALESLALTYREVVESTSHATGQRIERLHIVGGGIRNSLLNQLAANALGIPVFTGPVEATTMGNILVQAMATGALRDVTEIRALVRSSVEPAEYSPGDRDAWERKYQAFVALGDRGTA